MNSRMLGTTALATASVLLGLVAAQVKVMAGPVAKPVITEIEGSLCELRTCTGIVFASTPVDASGNPLPANMSCVTTAANPLYLCMKKSEGTCSSPGGIGPICPGTFLDNDGKFKPCNQVAARC
jgi:hypothetical protein